MNKPLDKDLIQGIDDLIQTFQTIKSDYENRRVGPRNTFEKVRKTCLAYGGIPVLDASALGVPMELEEDEDD